MKSWSWKPLVLPTHKNGGGGVFIKPPDSSSIRKSVATGQQSADNRAEVCALLVAAETQNQEERLPTSAVLDWLPVHSSGFVCLLVGCLTSQQQASVSQGRICSDNFTCCHTEIEVADPTFCRTQSQYTDTGPTSPSADPITPGAWQGSHWSANF